MPCISLCCVRCLVASDQPMAGMHRTSLSHVSSHRFHVPGFHMSSPPPPPLPPLRPRPRGVAALPCTHTWCLPVLCIVSGVKRSANGWNAQNQSQSCIITSIPRARLPYVATSTSTIAPSRPRGGLLRCCVRIHGVCPCCVLCLVSIDQPMAGMHRTSLGRVSSPDRNV